MKFWKWFLGQGKPEKVFALVTALKNTLCLETGVWTESPHGSLQDLEGLAILLPLGKAA